MRKSPTPIKECLGAIPGYKDQKKTNENVQTGDPMEYRVWAVVLVLCASVLGFTFRKKKC